MVDYIPSNDTLIAYADAITEVAHRITVFANDPRNSCKGDLKQQMINDTTDIFRAAFALRQCAGQQVIEEFYRGPSNESR